MKTEDIVMSQKDLDRMRVLEQVMSQRLSQVEAAKELKLSTRQVRRLQKRYAKEGARGLVSKRRGKPSPRRLSQAVCDEAIRLIKAHYPDFKPTLAHEKLTEVHGLSLSVERLRQLMKEAGLWKGKKRKAIVLHPQRPRRSREGELVQIDGSPHAWFEDRGPECCLLVYVDDATSKLMQLHFTPEESTQGYFEATERYLNTHGRPLGYYSDRHSIFRVNHPEAKSGNGQTQFSRAMGELGIELICANSPQAKGRVERANRVLQDRLVKELRLKGIDTIDEANAYLPTFMADYNKRFAVSPASPEDAHRCDIPEASIRSLIFSHQESRRISKQLEVSYKNVIYQIQTDKPSYTMRNSSVLVSERDGEVKLIYKGRCLAYKVLEKRTKPTEVVNSKELVKRQASKKYKPSANHPWRHYKKVNKRKTG